MEGEKYKMQGAEIGMCRSCRQRAEIHPTPKGMWCEACIQRGDNSWLFTAGQEKRTAIEEQKHQEEVFAPIHKSAVNPERVKLIDSLKRNGIHKRWFEAYILDDLVRIMIEDYMYFLESPRWFTVVDLQKYVNVMAEHPANNMRMTRGRPRKKKYGKKNPYVRKKPRDYYAEKKEKKEH